MSKKKRVVVAIRIFVISGILLLGLRCYLSLRTFSGSFDGLVVTTTKEDGRQKILLYDSSGSRRLVDFPESCLPSIFGYTVDGFAVASEARRIATIGRAGIYIITFDGEWVLEDKPPHHAIDRIAISPDGEHIGVISSVGGDSDRKYYAYIKHLGNPDDNWTEVKLPHAVLRYISIGPEGKTIVYEGASDDSWASCIYYHKLGESESRKLGQGRRPKLSADGTRAIWIQRDKVVVYDISADTRRIIDVSRVKSAAISPDNKFIALQITPFFQDIMASMMEVRSLGSGATVARFWREAHDFDTIGWMTTPDQ